jgi:hypothetical protein
MPEGIEMMMAKYSQPLILTISRQAVVGMPVAEVP